MPRLITDPAEFRLWLDNPATQEFLGLLRSRQVRLMEAWAKGAVDLPEVQAQAVLLGQLSRLRFSESQQDDGALAATIEDLADLDLSTEETTNE